MRADSGRIGTPIEIQSSTNNCRFLTARQQQATRTQLRGSVYRTYAVDTPRQVGKSAQTQAFANAQDLADWLADLLDGLGVARASLVGASYSGFLAPAAR